MHWGVSGGRSVERSISRSVGESSIRPWHSGSEAPPNIARTLAAICRYKGAPEGSAVHSMGMRSTLLRVEATFAFHKQAASAKNGKAAAAVACAEKEVGIRKKNVDLTSIIDVVTGGGQDCAV